MSQTDPEAGRGWGTEHATLELLSIVSKMSGWDADTAAAKLAPDVAEPTLGRFKDAPIDWRVHVPVGILKVWKELSPQTRLAVYIMAEGRYRALTDGPRG